MAIKLRSYNFKKDYERVGKFLLNNYKIQTAIPFNWCQPRWEYMHFHPYMDERDLYDVLNKIGIWEDKGKIVGVVHFEDELGQAYFEYSPDYLFLKKEMLDYALQNLGKELESGRKFIKVFVNEFDKEFEELVKKEKFTKDSKSSEINSSMKISLKKLKYSLPKRFNIQSLADENDLTKLHRILHRGFNHQGEPLPEGIEGRKKMQSAPNYNKSLNIVAVEPKNGNYVSICGSWYDSVNNFVYIEPVATNPDYRFLGLGKAVVLEAIKRNYEIGATLALVGSFQDFYKAIGFKYYFTNNCWVKYF
ncbi:hypothetical protein A2Z22_05250 [Candidatus Woesebacteria bacterium RBG_16_34_12]|uniref:N-acetyltransferase domain-containing protein n=1 Tax=Candidatus Woesebacteria bacterium RBG_16_34_12 TaxID=1802480 RepID=A0A1F7X8M6_9BACT|nr:MAG: hypothetical protein A2Z22_05250 [Candidatus Woesebacteria bacterium RBG_16_34_12]